MFTKPRRGIAFKNGKLYIFSNFRVCVLKPWPELAAWTRSKETPWQRFRPVLDLWGKSASAVRSHHRSPPDQTWLTRAEEARNLAAIAAMRAEEPSAYEAFHKREARKRSLIEEFTQSIPAEVRSLVSNFSTRHWHLLCMLARCDGSLEILRDNPALGFAMASCWAFADVRSGRAMGWIRRRISKRWRDIAADLGFPNRESVVRILSKLPPEDCCVRRILSLRDMIADPALMKVLAHAKVLDGLTIATLRHPTLRAASSPRLCAQIASGQPLPVERGRVARLFFDYVRMRREFGEDAQTPQRFHSVESLIKAHDALAARRCARWLLSDMQYEFPEPPLPSTEGIVPIRNVSELYAEAQEQQNCVASYAKYVADGEYYVYRMLAPERATISLRREGRGWTLGEVAAFRNASVSKSAYASVAAWLRIDLPF